MPSVAYMYSSCVLFHFQHVIVHQISQYLSLLIFRDPKNIRLLNFSKKILKFATKDAAATLHFVFLCDKLNVTFIIVMTFCAVYLKFFLLLKTGNYIHTSFSSTIH